MNTNATTATAERDTTGDQEWLKGIANTIFAQIGGRAGMGFARVTGSKNFVARFDQQKRPALQFDLCNLKEFLPDAKVIPNRCRIAYNAGADDYDITFEKVTAPRLSRKTYTFTERKIETVSITEGVYADQLQDIFERETNLLLDFCRVRFG